MLKGYYKTSNKSQDTPVPSVMSLFLFYETESFYVAQVCLELAPILLHQPPKCRDYGHILLQVHPCFRRFYNRQFRMPKFGKSELLNFKNKLNSEREKGSKANRFCNELMPPLSAQPPHMTCPQILWSSRM